MLMLAPQSDCSQPDDEEYFNPDYVEVDRVLDMVTAKDPATEDEVTHYLVKWRALSYEESTWELQQDVDPLKVQLFKDLRTPPPEDERPVSGRGALILLGLSCPCVCVSRGVISLGFRLFHGKAKSRFRETHIRSAKKACGYIQKSCQKVLFWLQIVPN